MNEGFDPLSLSFNYQPHSGNIPNELVVFGDTGLMSDIQIDAAPDWVNVILGDSGYDEESELFFQKFIISVKPEVANNLPVGYHAADFRFKCRMQRPPLYFPGDFTSQNLRIVLRVLQYTRLNISPSIFSYTHEMGSPNPEARYMQIETSNAWSIIPNQTWLSFSATNGTGSATIGVFVDKALLPIGRSVGRFLVDDGRTQIEGFVFVTLTGDDQNQYVIVNPASLEFSETYGRPATDVRSFTIDATEEATITADVPWLNISAASAPIGFSTISVNTQDTAILAIGAYPATITISNSLGEKFIDVLLIISKKQSQTLISNGFYFAEDRNRLTLNSEMPNAEAIINIKAQGEAFGLKNYSKKVPFYRNILSAVVGLETDILLKPAALPPLETIFYKHISPVRYDFRVAIKRMDNQPMPSNLVTIGNVQFINGRTPKASTLSGPTQAASVTLSYLPKKVTVPADGVLALNIYNKTASPTCKITKINQGLISLISLPVNVPETNIYTAIIALKNYNFIPGNDAVILFGSQKTEIQIKPTQHPTASIIWENEWNLPEIYNTTGPISITMNDGSKTVINSRDGQDFEKVIETKQPKSFSINTGNIYSTAEREHLATLLSGKRIWVQIGKNRYEVVHAIRNIEMFKTRDFVKDFDLKFKSAVV